MTDVQKNILQKMIDGKVSKLSGDTFWETTEFMGRANGYFRAVLKGINPEWDYYEKAWEMYKSLPLIKALG